MHAVARGAAYYGLARTGRGVRIRGGVPRTYYVGIESSLPAVPGMRAPVKALTVAPFGMEEGSSIDLRGREFGLIVGEPAEFRFFQSAVRKNDAAGAMLDDVGEELEELSPVEVMALPARGTPRAKPASSFRSRWKRWLPKPACCSFGRWRATGGGGSWSSTCGKKCEH